MNFITEQVSDRLFIQRSTNENYRPRFNPIYGIIHGSWWSWNPVTLEKHNIQEGINPNSYIQTFKSTFHPGRLSCPDNHRIPKTLKDKYYINNVTICPLTDLFGNWIPADWIQQILDVVEAHPEYTFISLTKNPKRYLEFKIPKNIRLGATAETQKRFDEALSVFNKMKNSNSKFLSCKPVLERIEYTKKQIGIVDWVIIGGLKGCENTGYQPEQEWVDNLISFAKDSGPLYFIK